MPGMTRRSVLAAGLGSATLYSLGGAHRVVAGAIAGSPTVETTYGPIRGTLEEGIPVFRGIPFAEPPVGRLRFRPPEPHKRWREVRDATQFGAMSPQVTSRLARVMGDFDFPQN